MANFYIKDIPDDVKRKAEAIGKLLGSSLKDIIVELLRQYVKDNQGKLVEAGQDRGGKKR
jgi:hypothetical protein